MRETATKTKYNKNIVNPSPLFIFHRKHAMDMMTNTNIMKKNVMEQTMPTEFTSTGFPYIIPYNNQGTGNLQNQSINTLNRFWFFIKRVAADEKPMWQQGFAWKAITLAPSGVRTYPTVTSNMLLPTEEETAMSPKPFLATMTEVIRSGMEVPAAKNVKPITSGGIVAVSQTTVAHHTIR